MPVKCKIVISVFFCRGKVLIVVNVASKCGYTKSNYEDLSELYDKYKDEGLAVLGFPCDQFGNQEPATEEEIKNFVCTRYKASFDMAKKINVNGSDAHPLWVFLKKQQVIMQLNLFFNTFISSHIDVWCSRNI